MAKILLHLKPKDVGHDLKGWHLRLYRSIRTLCEHHQIPFEIVPRDTDITVGTRKIEDGRFEDGNLHIIDDRSVQAPGVLNAGVAYFWEFWHLDPKGTKAFSSIGTKTYRPEAISTERAVRFASNLRDRYLTKRKSKYEQPEHSSQVPKDAVSVFFQGSYPKASGATGFSDLDMLSLVQAHAGDRPIVVKPHPLASAAKDIRTLNAAAQSDPRLIVSGANVHDILANSVLTVSINSTVALEGYLHGVPALLLGKSDFHHLAATALEAKDVASAFDQQLGRCEDFDRYLAWYFLRHCVPLNSGKLDAKIWQKFQSAGFGPDFFGAPRPD